MAEEKNDECKVIIALEKDDFEIKWAVKPGYVSQEQSLKRKPNCYITHVPSDTRTTGRDSQSRQVNKQVAFRNMIKNRKFREWLKGEIEKALEIFYEKMIK